MKNAPIKRIVGTTAFRWTAVVTADILLLSAFILYPAVRNLAIRYMPVCPLYAIGLRCGLCGGTHCLTALYNGSLLDAIRYNAYLVFILAYASVVLFFAHIWLIFPHGRAAALFRKLISQKTLIWIMSGWVAFMLLRNLFILAEKLLS